MDRAVALANTTQVRSIASLGDDAMRLELFLAGGWVQHVTLDRLPVKLVRSTSKTPSSRDLQWLGRHLSRTKLGLALGAGGAKCAAHIGVFKVLEEAGFTVDYIAGTSMGAFVAACIAMGMKAGDVAEATGRVLSPEICGPYFKLVSDEGIDGPRIFHDGLRHMAAGLAFSDLPIPLAVMAADLSTHSPCLFTDGAVGEALCATLTIPGLAQPYERGSQRLIDGVAISPVLTEAVRDLGSDVTVSVNLLSRDRLESWPRDIAIEPPPPKASKPIDVMLETLMMLQLDTSIRQAAEADVVLTPRFAPASWRDISLMPFFEHAGREAALACLPELRGLCSPSPDRTGFRSCPQ